MATMASNLNEGNPGFIQFLAWKIGKALDRSTAKERRVRTVLEASIRVLLHIVGFSCLTFAGFYWHVIAGLVMAGISCFLMAWLIGQTSPTPNRPNQTR